MKINLVSRDNGVGLSQDMRLLGEILRSGGHTAQMVDWRSNDTAPCDVAIFLELWNPRLASRARRVVGVFNLEWLPRRWHPELRRCTQLWAKSLEASQVYRRMGLSAARYTGFTSRDMYDPTIPRQLSCLHHRGKSTLKGTEVVLEAWKRHHASLPPVTIVSHAPIQAPPGVTVLPRLSDADLARQFNTHQIHLCPSRTEGWGHYLVEGMFAGAVVVTTNGSPMNEHIQPDRGILVDPSHRTARGLVRMHHMDPNSLAEAVQRAVAMSQDDRDRMGARARAHAVHAGQRFRATILDLIGKMS